MWSFAESSILSPRDPEMGRAVSYESTANKKFKNRRQDKRMFSTKSSQFLFPFPTKPYCKDSEEKKKKKKQTKLSPYTESIYSQATRSPLWDSLKASYAVANEALDLEEDDLADEAGDDALLFFFLFAFLGLLAMSGFSCPGLLSWKISMGSMLLGCSKSATN